MIGWESLSRWRASRGVGMQVTPGREPHRARAPKSAAGDQGRSAEADIVTIHLVLSPRSRDLIGAAEFALMKPTAYIINTSRGPIINEAALIAALETRQIAGAGLDVYDSEPVAAGHKLRKLPNVLATPHLGYVTDDTYRLFYGETVQNVKAWLDGKPVRVLQPPESKAP